MYRHPLSAYGSLGGLRAGAEARRGESAVDLITSQRRELQVEGKSIRKREKKRGTGGLLGGLGLGILATILTGGMASPLLASLIVGASTAAGSAGGQAIGIGGHKMPVGMWNVTKDKERKQHYKDALWADALKSGLAAGTFHYGLGKAGLLDKLLGKTAGGSPLGDYPNLLGNYT